MTPVVVSLILALVWRAKLNASFLFYPSVVLPHVGSATVETRTSMAVLAAKNLLAGLNNQPLVAQVEVSWELWEQNKYENYLLQ